MEIKRNHTIDIVKCFNAMMVVFLHFVFPGAIGKSVFSIARFAVPTFFAISGYFYNKKDKSKQLLSTKRKIKHIGMILLASELIMYGYCLIKMCAASCQFSFSFLYAVFVQAFNRYETWRLISFTPLFNYSAWFLVQLIVSYFLFACFTRYNLLTIVRPIVVSVFIIGFLSIRLLPHLGVVFPPYTDYFILFMGLPFFSLGYYLKEVSTPRALKTTHIYIMICFGAFLTLIEAALFSAVSLYFGSIIIVVSEMLLCKKHSGYQPRLGLVKWISYIGANLTLYIYILHSVVGSFSSRFYNKVESMVSSSHLSKLLTYMYPFYVLIVTTVVSIIIFVVSGWIKKLKRKDGKHEGGV